MSFISLGGGVGSFATSMTRVEPAVSGMPGSGPEKDLATAVFFRGIKPMTNEGIYNFLVCAADNGISLSRLGDEDVSPVLIPYNSRFGEFNAKLSSGLNSFELHFSAENFQSKMVIDLLEGVFRSAVSGNRRLLALYLDTGLINNLEFNQQEQQAVYSASTAFIELKTAQDKNPNWRFYVTSTDLETIQRIAILDKNSQARLPLNENIAEAARRVIRKIGRHHLVLFSTEHVPHAQIRASLIERAILVVLKERGVLGDLASRGFSSATQLKILEEILRRKVAFFTRRDEKTKNLVPVFDGSSDCASASVEFLRWFREMFFDPKTGRLKEEMPRLPDDTVPRLEVRKILAATDGKTTPAEKMEAEKEHPLWNQLFSNNRDGAYELAVNPGVEEIIRSSELSDASKSRLLHLLAYAEVRKPAVMGVIHTERCLFSKDVSVRAETIDNHPALIELEAILSGLLIE